MSGDKSIMAALAADGIVKQKLHVILVVDTSRSMQGERIDQVNEAIADIHKYLIGLQDENVNVDFYLSILPFANDSEFLDGYKGVNVNDMTPPKLKAIGYSNLHLAYERLEDTLRKESDGGMMPDFGGVAPIILLLTDGHPTRPTEEQLTALKTLPWYREALRYGVAIGLNDKRTIGELADFTEDRDCVVECVNSDSLARIIRLIVLTASKVKSQSSNVRAIGVKGAASLSMSARTQVKQQILDKLDDVDDLEW